MFYGNEKSFFKQECIPVGCVPSAAVAAGGGVYLSACWDTPLPLWTHACENITFPNYVADGNNGKEISETSFSWFIYTGTPVSRLVRWTLEMMLK